MNTEKACSDFVQVYRGGFSRLHSLLHDPAAIRVYLFLAENITAGVGAVVADQHFIAEVLEINQSTVSRALGRLEKSGALVRIKIGGRLNAYALNPEEVWKGWSDAKNYAAFKTNTVCRRDGSTDKKLRLMLKSRDGAASSDA